MSENRRKRQVPGRRDPFVNDHARRRALINRDADLLRRERISEWDYTDGDERRMKLHRQRYTFLMFLFFGLAMIVYAGSNLMSPKLTVTLSEGQGVVVVDDEVRGRTNTIIRNISPGIHYVSVISDDPLLIPVEREQEVRLEWSIAPEELLFYMIRTQPPPLQEPDAGEAADQ